ncbi:MAG: hypothetical protein ABIK65_15895 [Candidatus Eisenbacteria bacterium]
MRLAAALFALVLSLLLAALAFAEFNVELDLNGNVGDGPDLIEVMVSDYITGDLWILGDEPIYGVDWGICNYDGALEFQGVEYVLPLEWLSTPPVPGECVLLSAWHSDYTGTEKESWGSVKRRFRDGGSPHKTPPPEPITPPALVATLVYHAAVDDAIAGITLGTSTVTDIDMQQIHVANENTLLGTVHIGFGSPPKTNYRAIRGMFR